MASFLVTSLLVTFADSAAVATNYGVALLQAVLALVAVCLLAWVALRWAAKLGVGRSSKSGKIEVLERVGLDARRSLYLVRVGERVLLLGVGDGAAPVLLKELEPESTSTEDE